MDQGVQEIAHCLQAAEAALAIPVKVLGDLEPIDREQVAHLLETVGDGLPIGTLLVFAWALVKRLRETLTDDG